MSDIKVITGKIEVDGMIQAAEFEFEVENWDNLTEDEKQKEFNQAMWESGIINAWYEEDNEKTEK